MADPFTDSKVIARDLSASHIGLFIRFEVYDPATKVSQIITGELRDLAANAAHVNVGLGHRNSTTVATWRLVRNHPIRIHPSTKQVNHIEELRHPS